MHMVSEYVPNRGGEAHEKAVLCGPLRGGLTSFEAVAVMPNAPPDARLEWGRQICDRRGATAYAAPMAGITNQSPHYSPLSQNATSESCSALRSRRSPPFKQRWHVR